MKSLVIAGILSGAAILAAPALGQQRPEAAKAEPAGAPRFDSIEAINRAYEEELDAIERKRLEWLERLAAGLGKDQADSIYETYFRLAIASGLFRDAEPVAERVLRSPGPASPAASLAAIVNIIAEADRGAFEESLRSLAAVLQDPERQGEPARPATIPLPRSAKLSVVEAYYQRLVQAEQYETVKRAFRMIRDRAQDPVVEELARNRLRQLELIGAPAPPISGLDVDGQPVRLADYRGEVVLVVFWASWYSPADEQITRLEEVYEKFRERGFRVLGINVDAAQDGVSVESALPNIRRFLLDYNVEWPNIVYGRGDGAFLEAYGVTEVPSSALIGRDGKVVQIDMGTANLEREVSEALGR